MDPSQNLTSSELSRFSRHILLPEVGPEGQAKIKQARVLVIGTGGLGSPVSLYLAAAGVGTLGLVDFDLIDQTNLQRQILFQDADVGKSKVQVAAERVNALYPGIKTVIHEEKLTAANGLPIVNDYDLVIDGTDNFETRYLVNDICVLANKPNVYGSIFRFDGQASVFDATQGPCYRCLFPAAPPADQVPNCAEGGVLGVLPGMIGVMQATEALKIIIGMGTPLYGRLLMYDALSMSFQTFKINKDKSCPTCAIDKATLAERIQSHAKEATSTDVSVPIISAKALKDWRDQQHPHTLIDIRTAGERAICKIEGSLHIPQAELLSQIEKIDRSKPIVLHCKAGGRSERALRLLLENGYTKAWHLTGGILSWIEEVEPNLPRY